MKLNATQLLVIADHVGTKPEVKQALIYHLIDGLTLYSAEKKAGIGENTLKRKVKKIEKELEYIKRFHEAETKEAQLTLV